MSGNPASTQHLNGTAGRIRVAFVGKGGAGKSSIAGTFARLLAQRGEPVLALDSDPLPGMPYALGIPVDDDPIPPDVVVETEEGSNQWVLRPGLDAAALVDTYAAIGPDDVRYLQFGNTRGHWATIRRAQSAWSQVVREIDPTTWHLVGDLPGGTRQAMFGWGKYADTVMVVVEPTAKSLHVASRLLNLSKADWGPRQLLVIANKVDDSSDTARIEDRLDHAVSASVPRDAEVYANDRSGKSPLAEPVAKRFVHAVDALVDSVAATYDGITIQAAKDASGQPLEQEDEVYS